MMKRQPKSMAAVSTKRKRDTNLERPYIICHMLTSLDGKIIGDYLDEDRTAYFIKEYETIHNRYGCKAWMCGRITMEQHFTFGNKLDLEQEGIPAALN
jgi:hypothetical protein